MKKKIALVFFTLLGLGLFGKHYFPDKTFSQAERRFIHDFSFVSIAHRCAGNLFPENTLFACREISNHNLADILEIDVRLSKDNQLVLFHDLDLQRTTNHQGKISDYTAAELGLMDAAYFFQPNPIENDYPYRSMGIGIPRLSEVLLTIPNGKFLIEIKDNNPEAAIRLIELIAAHQLQDRLIIGSSHDAIKDVMQQMRPDLTYYGAKINIFHWVFSYILDSQSDLDFQLMAIPQNLIFYNLSAKVVAKAHSQGLLVYVWTINDMKTMQSLIAMGVDGIMTDEPIILQQAIDSSLTLKSSTQRARNNENRL